jgi:[ribosomal protein S5]-alanine N-acetyltransferase
VQRQGGDRQRDAAASRKRRTDPLVETLVDETTLETERLLLEPLLPEHAPLLMGDLADERLYRFIPTDAPESVEALERRYRKLSSLWQ